MSLAREGCSGTTVISYSTGMVVIPILILYLLVVRYTLVHGTAFYPSLPLCQWGAVWEVVFQAFP